MLAPRRRRLRLDEPIDTSSASSMPGYAVCWDNVQVMGHTKHQSGTTENPYIMLGMCFASGNRVPTTHLQNTDTHHAVSLPGSVFLPSMVDHQRRVERAIIIVERILTELIPALQHLRKYVTLHIPHQHSDAMSKESEIVSTFRVYMYGETYLEIPLLCESTLQL